MVVGGGDQGGGSTQQDRRQDVIRSHQVVLVTRVVSTSLLELQKAKLKSSGPRSGTSVVSLTKTPLKSFKLSHFDQSFTVV